MKERMQRAWFVGLFLQHTHTQLILRSKARWRLHSLLIKDTKKEEGPVCYQERNMNDPAFRFSMPSLRTPARVQELFRPPKIFFGRSSLQTKLVEQQSLTKCLDLHLTWPLPLSFRQAWLCQEFLFFQSCWRYNALAPDTVSWDQGGYPPEVKQEEGREAGWWREGCLPHQEMVCRDRIRLDMTGVKTNAYLLFILSINFFMTAPWEGIYLWELGSWSTCDLTPRTGCPQGKTHNILPSTSPVPGRGRHKTLRPISIQSHFWPYGHWLINMMKSVFPLSSKRSNYI